MKTPAPTFRDPQLGLFENKPEDANVVWLETLLKGAGCWMTSRDIIQTCGAKLLDRDVRELASASGWIISGQRGYKHMEHATIEECDHASNWLVSQGKKMIVRGMLLRRNAHKQIG
jgi:hypothetical protein